MIKLRIEKIDGYNYNLRDEKNNYYKLNIEFYGLAKNPDINDELYIHEELLKYQKTMFSFGPLSGEYGKEIKSAEDIDLLILIKNQEKIYLKRYYG